MVVMGDSGMVCRLRDKLVDLVGLLVCLEGLVDHLVALAAQMTLACPLSWC